MRSVNGPLGGVHTGSTWRIAFNRPCAAAMRPSCHITLTTCYSDRRQPNIGNTLGRVSTVSTRSAITSPTVNRFGLNMKHSETLSALLGTGPGRFWVRSAQSRDRECQAKFCFFCQVSDARLCRFLVSQISRNLNTTRQSLSR